MELMELYQQIKNPIDDPKVIEKLINVYANIPNGYEGYYTQLLSTVQKEHNNGQYYTADADKFYSMLFNKWKNNIIALNSEEFRKLYSQGSYGQDFIEMRNYLKSVPDVTTMNEADAILSGNTNNKDINNAIRKYSWKALGEDSDWIHVCSKYLTAQKEDYPNVEHRLYLDTESLDTYKMAELFVEKCDQHKLPYYFKFDELANRDDTIVIYSSTENLTKYVEILKEIQKEHPELVSRLKEPPVLAGRIDGWIGYGSEPQKTPDGKPQSFNKTRTKILENAIGNTTKQWIMDHRMMLVTYQGQELSFQDYIAMKGTEKLISSLEHKYNYWEKDGSFNPTMISNMLGYTLQDIKSGQFKKNVYEVLKSSISSSLSTVCNGNAKDMEFINMGVRNGKKIHFTGYDLEKTIQEVSVIISKIDSNFIPTIQSEIKNSAKQYGIDSEKFCFDIKSKERMMEVATQLDNQNISVSINDNKEKTILTNDSTNPNANLGSSGEDYYEMIDRELVPEGYYVWEGVEDKKVLEFSKDEILKLAEEEKPFSVSIFTMDTHFKDGYVDSSCSNKFSEHLSNAYACSSKMVNEFINWLKKQDFYKNTTIVLIGDHLNMNTNYFSEYPEYNRTIYNTFINSSVTDVSHTKNRLFSAYDLYPTILASVGAEIEGDKIGFGVNLFSGKKTMFEELGINEFNTELLKRSTYYSKYITNYTEIGKLNEEKNSKNNVKD